MDLFSAMPARRVAHHIVRAASRVNHRRPFEAHAAEEDTDPESSWLLAKIASCGAKTARRKSATCLRSAFSVSSSCRDRTAL